MPEYILAILFLIGLFCLELLYFKIALANKIIDKPNQRSSHKKFTIRGGGIIFPISILAWWIFDDFSYPWFIAGLLMISVISFLDDMNHLHSKIRFSVQAFSVICILLEPMLVPDMYWVALVVPVAVGILNAWNFMDGINGITGLYSLVTLGSLLYINEAVHPFIENHFLVASILSLVVFNYFNFRRKAHCFAGDVGSVSIAFIICFLLIKLIASTGNLLYLGLVLLYGLDTLTTITFRLIRKENIFEAHRSHFYQFLVNEQKWQHLTVSSFYGIVQLLINTLLITQFAPDLAISQSVIELISISGVSIGAFLVLRFVLEGHGRLLGGSVRQN